MREFVLMSVFHGVLDQFYQVVLLVAQELCLKHLMYLSLNFDVICFLSSIFLGSKDEPTTVCCQHWFTRKHCVCFWEELR